MHLQSIVRTYITHIRPRVKEDLDWYRQQPTLTEAMRSAALCVTSKGTRHLHCRRKPKTTLQQAYQVLLDNEKAIERCEDFDQLHTFLEGLLRRIKGIGEVYVYDTAFRTGARLGFLPGKVYLHAGTRAGAQALGFDRKAKVLELSQLPRELRQLEPYEIEDLLCIFKDELANVEEGTATQEAIRSSLCD